MFTDIEGYTALMQKSEQEALLFRETHRKVFNSNTEKFNGEIIQYYGDGTLSIFESAVDAIQCATAMQHAFQRKPAIPVRIGIHSGEIMISEEDIIGDSVNIASRVESLAVPGSVLISEKIFDEIKNNHEIQTTFLDTFKLKNVERPLGIYAISNAGLVVPDPETITGKIEAEKRWSKRIAKKLLLPSLITILLMAVVGFWLGARWGDIIKKRPDIKVVVLPLENSSSGEDEEYRQIGMTEELMAELSKINRLTVLGPSSSRVLKAGISSSNSLLSGEIERIDFYIDGTINQNDDQLNVEILLKRSMGDESPWKKTYSRNISAVRTLWSDIAADVSKQMGARIPARELSKRANIKAVDPETYELYLKGKYHLNKYTPEDMEKAIGYLEEALDRNPADAHAYAYLAEAYIFIGHSPNSRPGVFPKALSAARRAIQLDSTLAMGWAALSQYHTYVGRDWEVAEYAFERANELNPNLAYNHYHRAWYLVLHGRMNEAIEAHKVAQELEPFEAVHTAWLGEIYRLVGLYDEALAETEKAAQMVDGYSLSKFIEGMVYMDQGKTEKGLATLKESGWKYFGYAPALARAGRTAEARALIEELEVKPIDKWGAFCLASIYSNLGDNDKAFEYLAQAKKEAWYPWIRVEWISDNTKRDPRFLELMKELNLPPPGPLQFDAEALVD